MIYSSEKMEEQATLQVAAQMCAAARTAPKARKIDMIYTMVLTGEEKDVITDKMDEIGERDFDDKGVSWMKKDSNCIKKSQVLVMIGAKKSYRGQVHCGLCGFENCAKCAKAGGTCVFVNIDLGVALSTAASIAADFRIDNRIMMSAGVAAMEMEYIDNDIIWMGIPLCVSGKNVFFDRAKPQVTSK